MIGRRDLGVNFIKMFFKTFYVKIIYSNTYLVSTIRSRHKNQINNEEIGLWDNFFLHFLWVALLPKSNFGPLTRRKLHSPRAYYSLSLLNLTQRSPEASHEDWIQKFFWVSTLFHYACLFCSDPLGEDV